MERVLQKKLFRLSPSWSPFWSLSGFVVAAGRRGDEQPVFPSDHRGLRSNILGPWCQVGTIESLHLLSDYGLLPLPGRDSDSR